MSENAPNDRELCTVREIAQMLGISPAAVRKRALRGSLPAVKVGESLYIRRSEITLAIDPRDSAARKARKMSKIVVRPWNPTNPNTHEWEIDIRYTHPSERNEAGQPRRLRYRCKQVGTEASVRKWGESYVSAEIRRLATTLQTIPAPAKTSKAPTLAAFWDEYIDYMRSNGRKERTIESYETLWDLYLCEFLGNVALDQIGPAEIERIKNTLSKPRRVARGPRYNPRTGLATEGPSQEIDVAGLAPSSINQILHKVSAILGVAKYLGKITTIPEIRYCKEPAKERECYTFEEIERLTGAGYARVHVTADEDDELTAMQDLAVFIILLDTGIREGELIALHPDQVDLAAGLLDIKWTESSGKLTVPKGNRARKVPITDRMVPLLRFLLKQTPGPRLFMRVHKWHRTTETWSKAAVWEALDRIHVAAGATPGWRGSRAGRGPHKLRHTAATLMLEAGVDLRAVQKILGHARIEETAKYTHLQTDFLKSASARYQARFAQGRHLGDAGETPRDQPPMVH